MIKLSTLRIIHNEHTFGTGFFIAHDLVVTCAHVIAPAGEILQVQFTGQEEILSARVISEYYRDPDNGDIAFLRLESAPENITPLRLGTAEHSPSGNPFQAFGYPSVGEIEGVHARGEILGVVTENGQRLLQLRSDELNQGHSGAPVWDEKRGVIVGMVVSVYKADASGKLRDTAFAVLSETLWQVCSEIRPSEIHPYLGLETFTDETAQFFFGREALTEKLLGVLRGGCRFLAVLGPSGSGKSSVVCAGLLPALKKGQLPGSQKWAQITMRPADNPFEQMKAAGLDLIDINGYLKSHADVERVVLFIDQFEELFTLCPDEIRNRFARDLAAALDNSRLILILSMRNDFYSAFNAKAASLAESEHLKIENVSGNLKHDELVAMIERPAKAVGLALEEGLTELILKDVTTDGEARSATLPLLEFTLTQLWEKRRDGLLTHEAYQAIGGVTGSLARWADDAYSELPKTDQVLAESLLTSLVHLGNEVEGLPDTRKRCRLNELGESESMRRVIKHFVDRRLIVTNGEMVELVHDAMVREWGRLQSWLNENRRFLLWRQGIGDNLQRWIASAPDIRKRDKEQLLRGQEIIIAEEWFRKREADLNTVEHGFVRAGIKREKLVRRRMWAGIAGVMLILATAAVFSFWQAGVAQNFANSEAKARVIAQQNEAIAATERAKAIEQSTIARVGELAAQARIERERFPQRSLLLALEATEYKGSHLPTAEQALRDVLKGVGGRSIFQDEAMIMRVAFAPDGHWLAIRNGNGTTRLLDIDNLSAGSNVIGETAVAFSFSADDRWLAIGSRDGSVRILKRSSPLTEIEVLKGKGETITKLIFSPDGRWLAVGYDDGAIKIWDTQKLDTLELEITGLKTGTDFIFSVDSRRFVALNENGEVLFWDMLAISQKPTILGGRPLYPLNFVLSQSGHWLAVRVSESIQLWDMSNLETSDPLIILNYKGEGADLLFSPNDHWLTLGGKGEIHVWDILNLTPKSTVMNDGGRVFTISPDSQWLVADNSIGMLQIWNMQNLEAKPRSWSGHERGILDLEFNPKGNLLVTAGSDQIVRIWDINTLYVEPESFTDHEGTITALTFSPNGNWLATGSRDKTVRLWNMENLSSDRIVLREHTDSVNALAFSPDGYWLATGSADRTVLLWDIQNINTPPVVLNGHEQSVLGLAFSKNGRWLATASRDGTLRLWEMKELSKQPVILRGNGNDVSLVEFSSDDNWLAVGGNNSPARLWNTQNLTSNPVILTKDVGITALAFSSDGRWLATGDPNGIIQIFDMHNHAAEVHIFYGRPGPIWALAFSFDGRWLASGDVDEHTLLWSMENLNDGPTTLTTLQGHSYWVDDLAFSPDGHWLATGSPDQSTLLWDMQSLAKAPIILRASVNKLAFSPDGYWLATGGYDGVINFWRINLNDIKPLICQTAGRNFTQFEWQQYFPGEKYRATCPQWPLEAESTSTP
jgi:WD40 repeat protein